MEKKKKKIIPQGWLLHAGDATAQTCTLEATVTFLHANIFQSSDDKGRARIKTCNICGPRLNSAQCVRSSATATRLGQTSPFMK